MSEEPEHGFREHQVLLCLDKILYRAFIKLQADRELGRSYAGLLPWVEGMYALGYLSKEEYEFHKKRYSEPLIKPMEKVPAPISQEDRYFRNVIAQFQEHCSNPTWLVKTKNMAKQHLELESAKQVLAMIELLYSNKNGEKRP